MLIASYALQVRNAFVYIRGEFDLPYRRLAGALDEAYAAGYFGEEILGTGFACDLVIYRGAGSYVCGEASALITSIEGKRGYPRNRPPRLTVRGLYQQPTVINNVETLSNIVGIIAHGAEAFRKVGTAKNPGTRLISISGHINRPGVYEIEVGYPWAKFIYEDCGGIPGGRGLKAIIPGGISTKVLTGDGDRTAQSRQPGGRGGRLVAGLRRHDRHRRRHVHGAAAAGDAALLPPRVVRPMHAVPRRHGLAASDHRPHRRRRRTARGRRSPVPGIEAERRQHDLRDGRRRRLRDRRHPQQVSQRVRVLHRAQALALRRKPGMPRDLHRRAIDPGRARADRDAGGARQRHRHSRISAGTRRCRSPATAASAPSRSRAAAGWKSPATCR